MKKIGGGTARRESNLENTQRFSKRTSQNHLLYCMIDQEFKGLDQSLCIIW
jgi:hypothetical protein